MNLSHWVVASRPRTLAAAISPVLAGAGLAWRDRGEIDWRYAGCALLGALLIQVATNLINDALDFKKGADTAERVGPLRVTQAGLLSAEAVLRGAYVSFFLAALSGIPLIYRGGLPIVVIGICSIVAAYAYTGGPYPLAYHGLGELFVMLFFGLVAVGGTYYVLTLEYTIDALVSGFAIGSLAVVILAINNLRDIAGDGRSHKRTLAVRLGSRGARAEILAFVALAFVADLMMAWLNGDAWLLAPLLSLPLAVALVVRVFRSEGKELNRALALAGVLEWAFSVLFVIGCVL